MSNASACDINTQTHKWPTLAINRDSFIVKTELNRVMQSYAICAVCRHGSLCRQPCRKLLMFVGTSTNLVTRRWWHIMFPFYNVNCACNSDMHISSTNYTPSLHTTTTHQHYTIAMHHHYTPSRHNINVCVLRKRLVINEL